MLKRRGFNVTIEQYGPRVFQHVVVISWNTKKQSYVFDFVFETSQYVLDKNLIHKFLRTLEG